jgi:hypothetical protein
MFANSVFQPTLQNMAMANNETRLFHLTHSVGQKSGSSLVGWFWLKVLKVSQMVAVNISLDCKHLQRLEDPLLRWFTHIAVSRCLSSFSEGFLSILVTWQFAFPRMSESSDSKARRKLQCLLCPSLPTTMYEPLSPAHTQRVWN